MTKDTITHIRRLVAATAVAFALVGVASAAPAMANSVWWQLSSESWPSVLPANGEGKVVLLAENLGDTPAEHKGLTVKDTLPAGVAAQNVEFFLSSYSAGGSSLGQFCKTVGQEVTCELGESVLASVPLKPYETLEIRISVKTEGVSSGLENEASISGAEAPAVSVRRPLPAGSQASFGPTNYSLTPENADGSPDTQAGSHPFQLTSTLTLSQSANPARPPALVKDLHFNLPAGLIGNPTVLPQCTTQQFSTEVGQGLLFINECPADTAIGAAVITFDEPTILTNPRTFDVPLYNLTPAVGEPARFGFLIASIPVLLDTAVRTGGDYGVTVNVSNISELASLIGSRVTFWGTPGDSRHDRARGWDCLIGEHSEIGYPINSPCENVDQPKPPPFLILPTSCTGALQTSIQMDSWSAPDALTEPLEGSGEPALDGCNRLPFSSSISVVPDGLAGSTPTGLTVGVHVPQEEALNPAGLAPADVKDTTVTLPSGVALNPAGADGLLACSEEQIALQSHTEPTCPEASKVGTVEIQTPLLPNPLVGAAYLAAQDTNPFGSLVALYLVAEDPVSGTLIKLAGEVKPDPVTGQLVSTFLNTPQLPFEDLKLHFFGGSRAPLTTPAFCGAYTSTASIAPWSGNEAADSSSTFQVTSGPGGSSCASPLPFSPELTAGSLNIQAGGFTPFTTTMSRSDGQQSLQSIRLHMPPGLSGLLAGVKLCGEAEGNAGTCGAGSEIGETIVSVGVGGTPYSVKGGKVFITGPYEGAPFGLSITNPAKAGPYDLEKNTPCDCVVVRAKIEVDPVTAALTITTDNSGPYKIPTVLDGIPLQIQHVNVTINRPGFTFNPTDCSPMAITGSLQSTEGASKALSVPFQVTNCANLAFKPGFAVSTSGKTSRADGASLHVKLTYPKAPFGTQVNIKSVKVDLPKQLPSELRTLQHACPHEVFEVNPAGCPSTSRVGFAKATTPLIPVALEGPAYFVSYASLQFPELIVVLQGYGVTVDLHGETFISSKTNVTSSTFRTVPDVPVGSFELNLPEGPFSALGANANLCKVKGGLKMPTAFAAQNGLVIKQSTKVAVTGCAKAKSMKSKKAPKGRKKK
jgi:hypothetical protein